jgi:hypothetical protein
MKRIFSCLPLLVTSALILLSLLHGPIPQPAHYHEFADVRHAFGLPNAADVLSNIGFAMVGIWAMFRTRLSGNAYVAGSGWPGYRLFLIALILTAAGSFYYHLQPNDARLVWDRIPIALACAGLLAAVHGDTTRNSHAARNTRILAVVAVSSVVWWYWSGDLRPYLLMQALPLLLIPLWQWLHGAPRHERRAFGLAILLYILAKAAELHDHEVLAMTGVLSGHTIKHLLATAAAATIASVLARRTSST